MRPAGEAWAIGLTSIAAFSALISADCFSYGVDFQDGGSYFQNSLSIENFTFVSQYEGCQPDLANNIFIDPNGDQALCSDTNLTPDNTNQMSTCPKLKDQLFSGEWTIAIISNNGDTGEPIAYMREFSLSVGPQSTNTITPTVTKTDFVTPIITITSTTTDTLLTTLPASTTTVPSTTIHPTKTLYLPPSITFVTRTVLTLTRTIQSLSVAQTTVTATADCTVPARATSPDPPLTIAQTIISGIGPTPTANSAKFLHRMRRAIGEDIPSHPSFDGPSYVHARRARLSAAKRAPDPQPLIVTETDAAKFSTLTVTSSASTTLTATTITNVVVTATITPAPVTVVDGKTVGPVVTVTRAGFVWTQTVYTWAEVTRTVGQGATVTITSAHTPSATAEACRRNGGTLGGTRA